MKRFLRWMLVACVVSFAPDVARAQLPGSDALGLNAGLLRLFGKHTAFTLRAEVRVADRQTEKESIRLTMDLGRLDDQLRADIDLNQLTGRDLDPAVISKLKQIGLQQFSTLVNVNQGLTRYVYPKIKSYVEMRSPREDEPQIETKKLGKEKVAGRTCVKHQLTLKSRSGDQLQVHVWNAGDLKDFPVRMQLFQPEAIVTMDFSDVRFTRPEARLFDVPAGFEKYESMDRLMLNRLFAR